MHQGFSIPLAIGEYDIHFKALEPFVSPAFEANMWRSVLGMQLKRMSAGEASAPRDLPHGLRASDLYARIIEAAPAADAIMMRRYRSAPPPYMLPCSWRPAPRRIEAGEEIRLPLVLFGKINDLLASILLALSRGAAGGLGRSRARARLLHVDGPPPAPGKPRCVIFKHGGALLRPAPRRPETPPPPGNGLARLTFDTPLRLAVKGRILPPKRMAAYPLLMNIVRRASALCAFYGDAPLKADYPALKEAAGRVRLLERKLAWRDQKRWSARTRAEVPMGGVMGEMTLDISSAPEIWPFLWIGQWLHAGKGATLGLGHYRLREIPDGRPESF